MKLAVINLLVLFARALAGRRSGSAENHEIFSAFEAFDRVDHITIDTTNLSTSPTSYSLNIIPFGVQLNLTLTRLSDHPQYHSLLSKQLATTHPSVDVVYYENGRYESVREDLGKLQQCMFAGRVDGDASSSAFLSFCSNSSYLRGEIRTANDSYYIFSPSTSSGVIYAVRDSDLIIDQTANKKVVPSIINKSSSSKCCDNNHATNSFRSAADAPTNKRFRRSPTSWAYDYGNNDKNALPPLEWRSKRETISASPTSKFPVYEPYNFTVTTGLIVELVLVIDSSAYQYFNVKKREEAISRAVEILSLVNQLYEPLNVHFALVGVEVWIDRDPIVVTENSAESLDNFVQYRQQHLVARFPHDTAQLMSGKVFAGGVLGKALVGTVCSYKRSGGVVKVQSTRIGNVAATVAHELGHNLGMEHDNKLCDCPDRHCIMNDAISAWEIPTRWSSCAYSYLKWLKDRRADDCLHNVPKQMVNSPRCGNGWLEPGEQCDCGTVDNCRDNSCCNATTCQFALPDAECGTGSCCDLSSCKLRPGGTVCRAAASQACDLPEYCDGVGEHCPQDLHAMPGVPCVIATGDNVPKEEWEKFISAGGADSSANTAAGDPNAIEYADNLYYQLVPQHIMNAGLGKDGQQQQGGRQQLPVLPPTLAYCYAGECLSRAAQCSRLWGNTGTDASPLCYGELNVRGQVTGHCRQNITSEQYEACPDRLDAQCGLLQCNHSSLKIHYGGEGVSDWRETQLRQFDNSLLKCISVHIDNGLDMQDPGLVPNGAPCGVRGERVCLRQRCVPRTPQSIYNVLRGTSGASGISEVSECDADATCAGHGVCNSRGMCHCDVGYDAHSNCHSGGYGGSIDSGPATDPKTYRSWVKIVAIIFGGIVPACIALALLIVCRHRVVEAVRRSRVKARRPAAAVVAVATRRPPPPPTQQQQQRPAAAKASTNKPATTVAVRVDERPRLNRSGSMTSNGNNGGGGGIRVVTNKIVENVGSLRRQAKGAASAAVLAATNAASGGSSSSTAKPSPAMTRNEMLKNTARRSFGKGTLNKDLISKPVQVQSSTMMRMSDIVGGGGNNNSRSSSSAAVPTNPPPRPNVPPVAYRPSTAMPNNNNNNNNLYPSSELNVSNQIYNDNMPAARSGALSAGEVALEWPDSVSGGAASFNDRRPVRAAPPPPMMQRDDTANKFQRAAPPPLVPPKGTSKNAFSNNTMSSTPHRAHHNDPRRRASLTSSSSSSMRASTMTTPRPSARPPEPPSSSSRYVNNNDADLAGGASSHIYEEILREMNAVAGGGSSPALTSSPFMIRKNGSKQSSDINQHNHSPTAEEALLPSSNNTTKSGVGGSISQPARTVSELARKFGGGGLR